MDFKARDILDAGNNLRFSHHDEAISIIRDNQMRSIKNKVTPSQILLFPPQNHGEVTKFHICNQEVTCGFDLGMGTYGHSKVFDLSNSKLDFLIEREHAPSRTCTS